MQDSIVATFGSAANLTWIGSGFPLGPLILILPVGYIFDLFKNRNLYAGAIIIFIVGSVLCGASPTMVAIIAGRIIAGAGGGGMYLGALNCIGSLTKRCERTVYAAFTGIFYVCIVMLNFTTFANLRQKGTWRHFRTNYWRHDSIFFDYMEVGILHNCHRRGLASAFDRTFTCYGTPFRIWRVQ